MSGLSWTHTAIVSVLVAGAVVASVVGHDHALAGTLAGIAGGLLPGTLGGGRSLPPTITTAAPIVGALAGGAAAAALLGA